MADVNVNDLEQNGHIEKTLRPERMPESGYKIEPTPFNQYTQKMEASLCPICGASMDGDADYCESCQNYVRKDICSYCGALLDDSASYCSECGCPREGITCPYCNKVNNFSFCRQCGMPLTDDARLLFESKHADSDYKELGLLIRGLVDLENIIPYESENDVVKDKDTEKLRIRVLELLAKDKGITEPLIEKRVSRRMTKEEVNKRKKSQLSQMTEVLERMALKPIPSPVKARNFVMATKPMGVKVAWKCNYKQALHSSPCGCAKPHLGGKWVVLGYNNTEQIKDDIND